MNQIRHKTSGSVASLTISITSIIWLVQTNFPRLVLAQVQSDTTLGVEQSATITNGEAGNTSPGDLITGGVRRGINLFHSFESFNVKDGQSVYFNNPEGITRIFSRVTGNYLSAILGTLGVWDNVKHRIGNADLFFINPNGILLGQNARLDLGGSFIASTASSIIFADGTEFSTDSPSNTSLLTISIPVGLQFRNKVGEIRNQSQELAIRPNQTLAIIGGKVILDRESFITSGSSHESGGRIEIGGVGATEKVDLRPIPTGWAMGYEKVQSFADIHLLPVSSVNSVGGANFSSGDIKIRGKNVWFDAAQVVAINEGKNPGGKITIHASGSLELGGGDTFFGSPFKSVVSNQTQSSGRAGDIEIVAQNLRLFEGAAISTQAEAISSGQGGNLTITLTESLELKDASILSTSTFGRGRAGDLNIETKYLRISGGAEISASTAGESRGGNLLIDATAIELSGFSSETGRSSVIEVQSEENATAPGGNLAMNTESLRITDGAIINAATRSNYRGGDITINTNILEVLNGGQIISSTFSNGDAGDIIINVNNNSLLSGRNDNFSERLNKYGRETVENVGATSGIFANSDSDAVGNGGTIFLITPKLVIQDEAQVTVSSPQAQAGNLTINANSLTLNRGIITAETAKSGTEEGANINLEISDSLTLENESLISATAKGDANGGNININTPLLTVSNPTGSNGSDIIAKAVRGRGGNITINAQGIFGIAERPAISGNQSNDIDASSQFGASGQVEINSTIDPNRGVIQLPETVVDPNALVAQNPCKRGSESEFVVTGRGGLPPSLNENLNSEATQVDLIEPAPIAVEKQSEQTNINNNPILTPKAEEKTSSSPSETTPIFPAQGWVFNDKGEVVLVAYDPTVTGPQRLKDNPPGCPAP